MGIQLIEIIDFFKQAGFGVAGATMLWAWVFSRRGHEEIARRLLLPFFIALITASVAWLIGFSININTAWAHEGIAIGPLLDEVVAGRFFQAPFVAASIFLTLFIMIRKKAVSVTENVSSWFFMAQFILISFVLGLPAVTGSFSREQLFFIGHGWHSILTVGTVITVDILFLISRKSEAYKRDIYLAFPLMSKMIWLGLGIDFLSVGLIFNKAIELTDKFFFMQTVVGVLIINGVFLSGPLTRKLIASLKNSQLMAGRWRLAAGISGSVSVVSWLTITLMDQFSRPMLSYEQFMGFYFAAIILVFVFQNITESKGGA